MIKLDTERQNYLFIEGSKDDITGDKTYRFCPGGKCENCDLNCSIPKSETHCTGQYRKDGQSGCWKVVDSTNSRTYEQAFKELMDYFLDPSWSCNDPICEKEVIFQALEDIKHKNPKGLDFKLKEFWKKLIGSKNNNK